MRSGDVEHCTGTHVRSESLSSSQTLAEPELQRLKDFVCPENFVGCLLCSSVPFSCDLLKTKKSKGRKVDTFLRLIGSKVNTQVSHSNLGECN